MDKVTKIMWITIGCICIFIFMVAVSYSNTRELANKSTLEKAKAEKELMSKKPKIMDEETAAALMNNQNVNDLNNKIQKLEEQISNINNFSFDAQCKIKGVMVDGYVQNLPVESAVNEAKNNSRELVLTCKI